MPSFVLKFIAEIAKKSLYTFIALFVIAGSQRVAEYMNIKPVAQVLQMADGVLIQQRSTVIAQGPVVVVSDTSIVSPSISQ